MTVRNGAPVTNTNSAYAFASCKSCTTVAVSFQVVLVVGTSRIVAPINAAGALNVNCPACMTTAIADQIVVTLTKLPPQTLVQKLEAELKQLDALKALGANGTPAAIAAVVTTVQHEIEATLKSSGLLPKQTTSTAATSTTATSTTSTASTSTTRTPTTSTAQTTTGSTTTTTTSTPGASSTTPTTTTTDTGTTTTSG